MEYYIITRGKEYKVPMPVVMTNEELFKQYEIVTEDKKYLDLTGLIKENKRKDVERICDQCVSTIGMIMMDDETSENKHKFNELGPQIRHLDNMSKMFFEKGEDILGYENLLEQIELSLGFYDEIIKQEEQAIKPKSM